MRSVRKFFFVLMPLSALLLMCKNVADVKPTDRITFIRVYEKGGDFEAQVAEPVTDGFIIGSNLTHTLGSDAYITKTDGFGNILWEKILKSSSVIAIKVIDNGYLVFGDGIHINEGALNINDRTITSSRIVKMDANGNILDSAVLRLDPLDTLTDYHGTGITIDGSGNIVTTGNIKSSSTSSFYKAYVAVYKSDLSDTSWTRKYDLIDQDFLNARNVFTTSTNDILWANSVQKVNLTQNVSYLTIPLVEPGSVYSGYDFLGQTITANRLAAQEMQAAYNGYGVIGTFSDGQGKNGNIFFVKVGGTGKFQDNSLLFLDGISGVVPGDVTTLNSAPISQTEDVGRALAATPDGGFILGGSMTSTITRGNGGLDIWLTKIDLSGNIVWNKVYGGKEDEVVNSIRSLSDGSFLVAGGSTTSNLSSAFLMRIDANGEITQ